MVIDPNDSISKNYKIYHTNKFCRYYKNGLKKKMGKYCIECRFCYMINKKYHGY